MRLLPIFVLGLAPLLIFGQATPTVKQAPPPGITVPLETSTELKSGLDELGRKIDALRASLATKPAQLALLPDIEVFHKAVHDALVYDEFFKPAEFAQARQQLALGLARAAELEKPAPSWPAAHGPLLLAYQSRIDGSVQPYGLRVPNDWAPGQTQPRPLYLWFHGRGDTLTEVAFINGQLKAGREFAPSNAFELHLYGRYCNASKFAGETDAFEALADVERRYPIDVNRIAELGFSMGGATAWHMAVHYPGLWAAASPGAGFAETAIYANVFADKKEPPLPWEQTLWRVYDATVCAANLSNLPLIAYSGEIDPQKQSADIMEKALAAEGLKLDRLIGPGVAHKYQPDTKKELARRIDALVAQGRDPFPHKLRFVTFTLRYNQMKWITLDQLEKHWDRAEINAQYDDTSITATTTNINAFTITLPANSRSVTIDGQQIPHALSSSFRKTAGQWRSQPAPLEPGLHKAHALSGPIDDAFMDSFIFVRPTGKAFNETVGSWAQNELDRAIIEWRRVFRGQPRVKNDTEITADDIAQNNLVLWGDPGANSLLAKALPSLPLEWTRDQLTLGTLKVSASNHAPILIFPNPLNPRRYLVINSSFTFRQGSATSNSLQTPKLPDWAIVDLRVPPSLKWPGLITDAGFFDDHWQLQPR